MSEHHQVPTKQSAGLVLYRYRGTILEVFLGHPGGPFWAKRDAGAWSIPKGELDLDEDPQQAAVREFQEETGYRVQGTFHPLLPVRQRGGKLIYAWAVEGDINPDVIESNTFSFEWPPHSGRMAEFPELDRAEWFSIAEAARRIVKGQVPILEEFLKLVGAQVAED